jgi:hypothetical protein
MTSYLYNAAWELFRLADASPVLHFFGLLARGHDHDPASNGPSGPPSYGISWALMLFCAILGLMVTLTPSRRSVEIKKPKDE